MQAPLALNYMTALISAHPVASIIIISAAIIILIAIFCSGLLSELLDVIFEAWMGIDEDS